jgi:transcriptional regulator with XRE-family HTH domain
MASQNMYSLAVDSPEAQSFGTFLRRQREQRELPLRVVAAAAGMDQAHLSKAELGQRIPTPAQTAALALFFRQDPVEWEARRIAQRFRQDHAGNPAVARALLLLQGERETKAIGPAVTKDEPDRRSDNEVIVMHAD